jgi:hypothetical protein
MPPSKERILIGIISSFMKKLTDVDIEALVEGRARLVVEHAKPHTRSDNTTDHDSDRKLADVARRLRASSSRDVAGEILSSGQLRATELRKLMRVLDLPISKSDTVDKMRYKIIDSTVGYKLRSSAIRGRPRPESALHDPLQD